jgi:RHS repeat-associated protein
MQTFKLRLLTISFANLLLTCITFLFLTSPTTIYAQTDKTPARGFHPAGSYALSDLETISTTNGNLTMHIPLASLPAGRSGLTHGLTLNYNSKLFDHYSSVGTDPFISTSVNQDRLGFSAEGGWDYSYGYSLQVIDRNIQYPSTGLPQCPDQAAIYRYKVKMRFPDGSLHEFRPVGGFNYQQQDWFNVRPDGFVEACPNGGAMGTPPVYHSVDSSYMRLKLDPDANGNWWDNPWTLYLPDGGRVTFNEPNTAGQRIYDRNNNYIEIQSVDNYQSTGHPAELIVDQLGRSLVIEHNYNFPPLEGYEDYVRLKGFNDQALTWTIRWKDMWIYKKYAATAGNPYSDYDGSPFTEVISLFYPVIESITLPTQAGAGLKYNFTYNSNAAWPNLSEGWGELKSVSLPEGVRSSGATATYTYQVFGYDQPFQHVATQDVLNNTPIKKELTYWREYDGQASLTNPPETWLYSICPQCGVSYITEPSGGQIKEEFNPSGSSIPFWNTSLVYRTTQADGSVTERLWQQNIPQGMMPPLPSSGFHTGVNTYVKTEFKSIRHLPTDPVLALTAIKDYNYDKNGNLTQIVEYDWVLYTDVPRSSGFPTGIPAGAQVKRVIANTYYNPTPDASNSAGDHSNAYHLVTGTRWLRALESSETRSDFSATTALARSEYTYENYSTKGNVKEERSWDSTKGAISRPLTTGNSLAVKNEYGTWPGGATGKLLWTDDARKSAGNSGDPGSRTEYDYGDIDGLGHSELYPTQIRVASNVTAVKRTTNTKYDFQTGLVTEATDADNSIATRTTYDIFGRPTLVEEGVFNNSALRKTATTYSDTERRTITQSDLNNPGDGLLFSIQHYDQLGRLRLARTLENGNTNNEAENETIGIKVQTRYLYDIPNQRSLEITSAPYRAATASGATNEAGMAWRCSLFDKTGRLREVETFTGATLPAPLGNNTNSTGKIVTDYDAELVLVTDQAGKNRKSGIDALGRLVKVWEDPLGANHETTYIYNALDSLTTVEQGAQTRTFNYDSLKRLTSATNPESGTVSYRYDANGNLLTKTDARKWVTRYTYDALNRNKTVDYSNTLISPDITRIYDNPANGKGLLWKEYANGNEEQGANVEYREIGSYDKLGRPLSVSQKAKFNNNTWTVPFTTAQTYNPAGQVKMITYPTGRTVNYVYDAAGRLLNFTGNLGGLSQNYATNLTYNARGQLRREQFGTTGTPAALYHRMYYNARGQMTDARLGTGETGFDAETPQAGASWWNSWDRGALRWTYGGTTTNNGNVTRQEHLIPQAEPNLAYNVQLYDYDPLNRLSKVTEKTGTQDGNGGKLDGATTFKQAFAYDRWGNRTIDLTNSSLQTEVPWLNLKQYKVDAATNRLAANGDVINPARDLGDRMKYDEAGNLIFDSWTDDTTGLVAGKRTYDAENRMVKAVGKDNLSQSYSYDAGGRRVRRVIYNNGVQETWWQVYGVGGELVAEYKLMNGAPVLQKEYGYRNGQLLVVYDAAETGDKQWQWLVTDALGTPRMVVNRSGRLTDDPATTGVDERLVRHDYLPFGEELAAGAGTLRTTLNGYEAVTNKLRQKFTGKERDGETGLDYFLARYYSNVQGRFTSPDEFTGGPDELYDFAYIASENPTFYAELEEPQTLNKYHYAINNPLRYIDPDGHQGMAVAAKRGWETTKEVVKVPGVPPQIKVVVVVGVWGTVIGSQVDWNAVWDGLVKVGSQSGGGCLSTPCPYWIYSKATGSQANSQNSSNRDKGNSQNSNTSNQSNDNNQSGNNQGERKQQGPVFKNTKEAQAKAEELGFTKIKATSNGQAVFSNGKMFITRDVDGHNGGAWKAASSVKALGSKKTRSGTYDADLNRIGD